MPGLVKTADAGHSLVEVLTALALASAGVIGFMHAQHLRETTETELLARTRAVMLADDIARKAAANLGALERYRVAFDAPPPGAADCRGSACNRDRLAAFHVAHWKCRLGRWAEHAVCRDGFKLRGLLPAGDGRVDPRGGGGVNVEIRWLGADGEWQSLEANHVLPPR